MTALTLLKDSNTPKGYIQFISSYQGIHDYSYVSRVDGISRIELKAIHLLPKHHIVRTAYAYYIAESRVKVRAYILRNGITFSQFKQISKGTLSWGDIKAA